MENLILIKYGELTTKKDNIKTFINCLEKNLVYQLRNYNCKIIKERMRMYIKFSSFSSNIVKVISNTFGIHAFNIAYKVNTNCDDIKDRVLDLIKEQKFKTFKVVTNRRDKTFPIKSMEFNDIIGGHILKNIKDIKVDVHNPDLFVNIEINKDDTYIYFNEIKGLGGYPVGVLGKGLLMLSGGIDSPVAGYLAMKRGVSLDAVYFEAIPHTSLDAREKVISLAKKLLNYTSSINLYVVSLTDIEETIYNKCSSEYIITILRRMMYRIAETLATQNNDLAIVNGESIGQVASQTLSSMKVINSVVKIPVIRPVACLDKLEIISIANKIDTYKTSILPYEDCCTIFVPKHPVINPKEDKCLYEESLFDYEEKIKTAVLSAKKIKITSDIIDSELL